MLVIAIKLFKNKVMRIFKLFQFFGIDEVMIRRLGDAVIITKLKTWASLTDEDVTDADFMVQCPDLIETDRVVF